MQRGVLSSCVLPFLICFPAAQACLAQKQVLSAAVNAPLNSAPHTSAPAGSRPETYKIGAGDVLQVTVWREDNLSQRVVVRPDGKVTLPLIGEVPVQGRTPLEVRDALQKSFSAYIEHPAVMVTVVEMNSQVVYILGEVQRPGAYPMTRNMDVLQLIASAGGLTPFARKKGIYLLHDETKQRTALDYARLLKGKGLDAGLGLKAGDLVVVP